MTSDLCGKRQPGGIFRCERPKGHEGNHHALDTVEGGLYMWPNHSDRDTRAPLKRGKRPRAVSDKQAQRTAFLHGIKAERMRCQNMRAMTLSDAAPRYRCESNRGCGFCTNDFDEAWEKLTVSHIEPRNDTASRYERRREPDFRGDDPSNILLECVPCNQEREPQPDWSSAS